MRYLSFILIIFLFYSCDKEVIIPIDLKLYQSPLIGDTSIFINFSIDNNGTSHDNFERFYYCWDFQGDGQWDNCGYGATNIIHKYISPGTFNPIVMLTADGYLPKIIKSEILILGKNQQQGYLLDARDSTKYRTVMIGEKWWMAENLNFGKIISPECDQTDNNIVERHVCGENPAGIPPNDGVYLWFEAMNYQKDLQKGICPDGWHIPNDEEWESLFNVLPGLTVRQWEDFLTGDLSGINLSSGLYYQ